MNLKSDVHTVNSKGDTAFCGASVLLCCVSNTSLCRPTNCSTSVRW